MTYSVGSELGLRTNELELVTQGAFFHDLGKMSWPVQLVDKVPLNADDWNVIRAHPIAGEYYLRQEIPNAPELVCRIIREHHERSNGKGYPKGKKEDEIHPLSLLVAAMEVYSALREDRPYRPAWRKSDALAELKRQKFPERIIKLLEKTDPALFLLPASTVQNRMVR